MKPVREAKARSRAIVPLKKKKKKKENTHKNSMMFCKRRQTFNNKTCLCTDGDEML
jgi:hypothetical protein